MSAPQHIVCVFERGTLGVIGRYPTEGEAARAMRGAGPTAHVVLDGELLKTHHAMSATDERRIERALEAGTHPALPLARYAAPAPEAPATQPPAPVEAPAATEEPAAAPAAPEQPADEASEEPSLAEVARLTEVALRTAGTQRVLAEALGVSEATVCRAANGTRRVNAAFIDALRDYVERHPAPPAPSPEGAAALLRQAVDQAGSIHLLAAAIGRDYSGLYRARASGSYSPALVEALRAYVEGPAQAPEEPAAGEAPVEALAPEVEAPRPAPVEAPLPPMHRLPARPSDEVVTLHLGRDEAVRLYQMLALTPELMLRLAVADALLGAA